MAGKTSLDDARPRGCFIEAASPVPGQFGRVSAASAQACREALSDTCCLGAGTRILTPDGDVSIEHLRVGDEVLTLRGEGDALGRVIWTGRRAIDLARHARPEKVNPVRILAGALGPCLPERDLLLSPDHCLFMDGHLIEAKTLINGATVIQDESFRQITYHHIELERHDVVLAEGVPVETFLDCGNRRMFDGASTHVLHAEFAPASRKNACARLVRNGTVVESARRRLFGHAKALGFTMSETCDLSVKAGIERLLPAADSQPNRLQFELAAPYRAVQLLSSAGVPAHTGADPQDLRRLGVAVTALRLLTAGGQIDIALDDPGHRGFHDAEGTHRWTNGAARIALPPFDGNAILEVEVRGQAARWVIEGGSAAISA
jgi:hypothetical protein